MYIRPDERRPPERQQLSWYLISNTAWSNRQWIKDIYWKSDIRQLMFRKAGTILISYRLWASYWLEFEREEQLDLPGSGRTVVVWSVTMRLLLQMEKSSMLLQIKRISMTSKKRRISMKFQIREISIPPRKGGAKWSALQKGDHWSSIYGGDHWSSRWRWAQCSSRKIGSQWPPRKGYIRAHWFLRN